EVVRDLEQRLAVDARDGRSRRGDGFDHGLSPFGDGRVHRRILQRFPKQTTSCCGQPWMDPLFNVASEAQEAA
ncbi:MAG: hypothetical protein ACXW2A_19260, partial [Burkholderiales bacterium]